MRRRTLLGLPLLAALPPLPAAPRLLILGDSLARGAYASNPAASYAGRVAVALGATESTLVPAGGRLETAERDWAAYGGQGWDLVILEVGINDSLAPTMGEQEWLVRYAALSAAFPRPLCVTPFDTGHEELEARAALIRGAGFPVADVYAATRGRSDLRAPLYAPSFYAQATDAWHPNDAGHRVIAGVILGTRVGLPVVR